MVMVLRVVKNGAMIIDSSSRNVAVNGERGNKIESSRDM